MGRRRESLDLGQETSRIAQEREDLPPGQGHMVVDPGPLASGLYHEDTFCGPIREGRGWAVNP